MYKNYHETSTLLHRLFYGMNHGSLCYKRRFAHLQRHRFSKKRKKIDKKIDTNIPLDKLGKEVKIKGLEVKEQKRKLVIFKVDTYNSKTDEAKYTKKTLFFPKKMMYLHKSD